MQIFNILSSLGRSADWFEVDQQTGLSLTLLETLKTGFRTSRPKYIDNEMTPGTGLT